MGVVREGPVTEQPPTLQTGKGGMNISVLHKRGKPHNSLGIADVTECELCRAGRSRLSSP